jgi:beta-ureidopropionase / N-carbamoyl-L-amino-acid hydrolase
MKDLKVNEERLWSRLMKMAQIGATPKGGVCRVALTDEDKDGRDLFVQWCESAGLKIYIDEMGNIFGRRDGRFNDLPPVLSGSHLDSQPTGGKFDGVYGVLAALEVIETLNDNDIITDAPLEIVSWTNEEGARFTPAMIASGVFAGIFDLDYAYSRTDKEGLTIGDELKRIGYAGEKPAKAESYKAAFEAHIEQGPILENEKKQIGIVTGVQGARWYHLTILGRDAHAGTTPMEARQDPVKVAASLLSQAYALADEYLPDIRLTFGDLRPSPGVVNTVPGKLVITVDIRHPVDEILDEFEEKLNKIVQAHGAKLDNFWKSPAIVFHPDCISTVEQAVANTDTSAKHMISGAGHDAVYLSRVALTSMIFIPCKDGLSHNELESAKKEDASAGASVLLQAMLIASKK